jgi:hypothetical protein
MQDFVEEFIAKPVDYFDLNEPARCSHKTTQHKRHKRNLLFINSNIFKHFLIRDEEMTFMQLLINRKLRKLHKKNQQESKNDAHSAHFDISCHFFASKYFFLTVFDISIKLFENILEKKQKMEILNFDEDLNEEFRIGDENLIASSDDAFGQLTEGS